MRSLGRMERPEMVPPPVTMAKKTKTTKILDKSKGFYMINL